MKNNQTQKEEMISISEKKQDEKVTRIQIIDAKRKVVWFV